MADLHIEDFFADSCKIVASIYLVFPRPITLFVEDISGPDEPDEYGVHSARHQSCFASMLWLAQENYLSFQDTIRSEAIDQAVLSGRCISALLSPCPESSQHQNRIQLIQAAIKTRSNTQMAKAFEPLLHSMVST